MRSSLRTWLLVLSLLFSLVLVGAVAVTTFFVVSQGMRSTAEATAWRLSQLASEEVRQRITEAKLEAAAAGLEGEQRDAEAERLFERDLIRTFRTGAAVDGQFALYDHDESLIWFSEPGARFELAESRRQALDQGRSEVTRISGSGLLTGLATTANLGVIIVHVPVALPSEHMVVLDIVYRPVREEQVIDSIRRPMATLAVVAMAATILMMQLSMGWVLSLVNDLRRAADSIDAGDLHVHLPDMGEHEVGYLAASLNRLIERLRRRSEMQTRFVADASHELATPVAGIRGYINILKEWGAEDPQVRDEAVEAIDRESRRMARLTNDLLRLVRSGRETQPRSLRFDVNARVGEVLTMIEMRYRSKGLEFVGPDAGQLYLVGDPDRIEDVVAILVDNAAKYTPPGGRVEVRTRRRRDVVIIEVSDTGIGIPPDDIGNIFERFYRSDASRSQETGGFGLGLAIAKHIVDTSGGQIDVQSIVGSGTVFTIRLPRAGL